MKATLQTSYRVILILSLTFMSSCAVQLAPRYNAALFDGITHINVEIMTLFASVSTGTNNSTCATREQVYSALIGTLDALTIQSKARPVPENAVTEKVNDLLESRGMGAMTGNVAPSANALQAVSVQLTKMKEVDCRTGLRPGAVAAFKNAVIISMDQAITYESFLNR